MNKALKFNLTFAKKQDSPYDGIDFAQRISVYRPSRGPEKTIPVLAPAAWSQTAVDMLAQKYLRKAGVPSKVVQQPKSTLPPNLPDWLRPAIPGVGAEFGAETDSREVFRRIAGHWTYWGWIEGYFADGDSACNFFADIQAILALQIAAPASPQWFNTGLWWAYGILGPDQGLWAAGPGSQTRVSRQPNAYQRPQLSACFINSVQDSLLDSNGIISTVEREARIFKFGGGSGANFSLLRAAGEPLTGGGVSSGLMSWLKVLDASAGSIKSGGVTRRAAKMICLDVDHPDIQDFIGWKKREEEKVAALVVGSNVLADIAEGKPTTFDPASAGLPDTLGSSPLAIGRLDTAYEGDAYQTVSGQNANNSVRINELFMQKITGKSPDDWSLIDRISTNKRVISAKALWRQIAQTAWSSADPGVQFHTTINDWNTCMNDGIIRASNPCSEYHFLDDTACNLASLNLSKFVIPGLPLWEGGFRVSEYRTAARLMTVALDISVRLAAYPSEAVANGSRNYRTIRLGFANLGAVLMGAALPYDSDEGREVGGLLAAILHFTALNTSAELANAVGRFPRYDANAEACLRVVVNHRAALHELPLAPPMSVTPPPLPFALPAGHALRRAAVAASDIALASVQNYGLRNAQVTVMAPTGTIGLLMDCDTTGVEPDFALVKFKTLAGGGVMRLANQSIRTALKSLGYTAKQIDRIVAHVAGCDPATAPFDFASRATAIRPGSPLTEVAADFVAGRLDLGLPAAAALALRECLTGTGDISSSPDLVADPGPRERHLSVFDCATPPRPGGRSIHWTGHLKMLSAIQPFVSGSISKTINMPADTTVDDVESAHLMAWKLALKCVAVYRDGSKLSQPLAGASRSPEPAVEATQSPANTLPVPNATSPGRRRLPSRRAGYTQKVRIGDHKLYVRTGEYEDGTLGEIFIDMHKEGAAFRSMMNAFAIAISLGLQHGVPLDEYVDAFVFTRFEPNGPVRGHHHIKMCTSILDAIFRDLGIHYLGRGDLSHAADPAPTSESVARPAPAVSERPERGKSSSPEPEGSPCWVCGSLSLVRAGTCLLCRSCGASSGCG